MDNELNADRIRNTIEVQPAPIIKVFDQISSTQTFCLKHRFVSPHLVVANGQSQGRGQRGHRFYSPRVSGVYLTITLPAQPRFVRNPGLLTAGVGIAVIKALQPVIKIPVRLKWMNDVYCHRRKCGGILVETNSSATNQIRSWVIGIGLNLYGERFPDSIQHRAGCLFNRRPQFSRNDLIAKIYNQLIRVDLTTSNQKIISQYRRWMLWRHCRVTFRVSGRVRSGIILGIDSRARLIVRSHQHVRHFNYQNAHQIRLIN